MLVMEVTMRFLPVRAHDSTPRRKPHHWSSRWLVPGAVIAGMLTLACFAQMTTPPTRPPRPLIMPEANPMPDKNDQMKMQERNAIRRNFDAANAERLKQMMKATEMLETMAMSLKAEVDDSKSGSLSENALRKADTIEKLARIVKERMMLNVATQ
jgi:hypothetical protein